MELQTALFRVEIISARYQIGGSDRAGWFNLIDGIVQVWASRQRPYMVTHHKTVWL